jgi:hypothetical protein
MAFLVVVNPPRAQRESYESPAKISLRKIFAGGSCDSGGIVFHDAAARVKSR